MKVIFSLFFAFITLAAITIESYAQTLDTNKTSKAKKILVSVPVAVSDRSGRYISGLRKSDFTIYRDGEKQEIVSFATEKEPVNVALLLDTSRSTKKVLGKIKDAAKDFINLLNPQDKCLIATFDSAVTILSPLNSDHAQLENAIKNVKIGDKTGTVMRKAVSQVAESSFGKVEGRKALIILTDGKDFGSFITKDELMDMLQESDLIIYTVFYKTGLDAAKPKTSIETKKDKAKNSKPKREKDRKYSINLKIPEGEFPTQAEIDEREKKSSIEAIDTLKGMSEATAGRFYLRDVTNLSKTFEQIADELRDQYRLGFYQIDGDDAALHQIKVKVTDPEMVVRSRGTFKAKRLKVE